MPIVTRVALETLGCKLNQAETGALARHLSCAGFCTVNPDDEFDVYILNSCTVTAAADAKARHLLRLAYRRGPGAVLVLTGCFSESVSRLKDEIPNLKLILPNLEKPQLVEKLHELGLAGGAGNKGEAPRTRAFIKAQEGCSNYCSYCIVPFVRGKESCRPPEDVIEEINIRVSEGYKEIVLTGTEIGAYRCNGTGLSGLIKSVLVETRLARLRISSLQPPEITSDLLENWRNSRLCPHFHLSLQNGSDDVLKRMNRRYDAKNYHETVARIQAAVEEAAITTDIIVGFPGETEADFQQTCRLCEGLGFSRIHVFTFSPRPGTTAARMSGQVPEQLKKERAQIMLALARDSAKRYRARFLGHTMEVLWEQQKKGFWSGYTGNYLRVFSRDAKIRANDITAVKLSKLFKDGILVDGE
jgi:threonylcarbamoyladenosine tRNA methylthiotransferase MtaB